MKNVVMLIYFLQDFTVGELLNYQKMILFIRTILLAFAIKAFICDALAKSLITYCKGYTKFFSCMKCIQKKKYI